jgi:WD40 repeat protein
LEQIARANEEGNMRSIVAAIVFSALVQATSVAQELKERARFEGHHKVVACLACSADGKLVASVDADRTLILWDVATGEILHTLQAPSARRRDLLAFSQDGKTLASADPKGGKVVCWDTADGKEIRTIQAETKQLYLVSLALSPDGSLLATGTLSNIPKLWQVKTGVEEKAVRLGGDGGELVTQLAFSPDGKTLAVVGYTVKGLSRPYYVCRVVLWDVREKTVRGEVEGGSGKASGVAFSPDGKTLAVSGDRVREGKQDVLIVDVTSGKKKEVIRVVVETNPKEEEDDRDWQTPLSFVPGGLLLASTRGYGHVVTVRECRTGRLVGERPVDPDGLPSSMAFSPDGRTLVTASGKVIRLWDLPFSDR